MSLFLKALRCEEVPRPPVWLMRQAGRYMPQYRALKEKHSLFEMFHLPEVAAEVTLLPETLLGVDALILFSDILMVAEALGCQVAFPDKGGPKIYPAIHSSHAAHGLPLLDVRERLSFVYETIRLVKKRSELPLIGFCGGPFTVASYMIDSTSQEAFVRTKEWLKKEPSTFHALLEKITEVTIASLQEQVRAGVDVVQIFDSWANILTDEEFETFSLRYLGKIVRALHPTPVILFCRSSSLRAPQLSSLNPAAISFDWNQPLHVLRQTVPAHIAVQGNFDPELLKKPQEEIAKEIEAFWAPLQKAKGVIVNLGHGVTPETPFENVQFFVNRIHHCASGGIEQRIASGLP